MDIRKLFLLIYTAVSQIWNTVILLINPNIRHFGCKLNCQRVTVRCAIFDTNSIVLSSDYNPLPHPFVRNKGDFVEAFIEILPQLPWI